MNRGLLRAAIDVCPNEIEIRPFDLAMIPVFNADLKATGDPDPVARFTEAIACADALLIATPEYNFSIPGVLKNAIDWASLPPRKSVLRHKPIALMGASSGKSGTMRCQQALRMVLGATQSFVMLQPEIYVPQAAPHFDEEGSLISDNVREDIRELLVSLRKWSRQLHA